MVVIIRYKERVATQSTQTWQPHAHSDLHARLEKEVKGGEVRTTELYYKHCSACRVPVISGV